MLGVPWGLLCMDLDWSCVARDPLGEVGEEALVVKLGSFCMNRDSSPVARDPLGEIGPPVADKFLSE